MPIPKITTTKSGDNHWNVWQDDEINLGTIEHLGRARWRIKPSDNLQGPGIMPRSRKQAIHFLQMARIANQSKNG